MSERNLAPVSHLLVTPEPPELGPGPRAGVIPEAELNRRLKAAGAGAGLSRPRWELIRSLVLLWHDHLDAAHTIAQGIEDTDGSFVHAIMHRREPDAWNSKYWWRRVGNHAAFPELARRVGEFLRGHEREGANLAQRLLPGGAWDAAAFVDACDAAEDPSLIQRLREIQRIETEVLLEHFCHE